MCACVCVCVCVFECVCVSVFVCVYIYVVYQPRGRGCRVGINVMCRLYFLSSDANALCILSETQSIQCRKRGRGTVVLIHVLVVCVFEQYKLTNAKWIRH